MERKEVKQVLGSMLKAVTEGKQTSAIYLRGPVGTGKTALCEEIAKEMGLEFVVFSAPEKDYYDLRHWVSTLPTRGKGILVVELGSFSLSALTRVKFALFKLIIDKQVGDYALPAGWQIVIVEDSPSLDTDFLGTFDCVPIAVINRCHILNLEVN